MAATPETTEPLTRDLGRVGELPAPELCRETARLHTHPVCPDCGAVRYGNVLCGTCRQLRGADPNPHTLVPEVPDARE